MSNDRNGRSPKKKHESVEGKKDQGNSSGKEQSKKRQKVITLVISLIVACGLWLYVMEEVNPVVNRSFSGIRVHVMNQSALTVKKLTVTSEEDQYVRIRVSGKRRTLMDLDSSDFIATADASHCTAGENYINVEVKTNAPVQIDKVTSSQIRLDVESIVNEPRDVKVAYTGDVESGCQPVTVQQEISSVEVTGSQSKVASTAEVRATVRTENLSDEKKELKVKLTAVDRKGREVSGVQLSQKNMLVGAQIYVQKEVELHTSYTGQVSEGYKLVSFEVPEMIRIALPKTEVDRVYSVTAEPVVLTGIEKSTELDLNLHMPGNAVLAEDQETPKATVKVAKITQQTIEADTESIKVENLPAGRELSFNTPSVDIVLTGTASDLSALKKKDIRLSVNAAWANRYTTELPLNVEIDTESGLSDVKAETGNVAVTVS